MLALALRQAQEAIPRCAPGTCSASCLFYCALFVHPGCTVYTTSLVHADAPSLGLALLACLPLYRVNASEAPGWRALSVSALLASLSVWCKQTSVFVPLALATHLLLAWGAPLSCGGICCACWPSGGGLSAAAGGLPSGRAPLFFNLFTVTGGAAMDHPAARRGARARRPAAWRSLRSCCWRCTSRSTPRDAERRRRAAPGGAPTPGECCCCSPSSRFPPPCWPA